MISHYENHVYCMKMGHWIKRTALIRLKSGRLTCPLHHGRVRLKPRASCRNRTLKRNGKRINVVDEMDKMERKEILLK
jgi:hypothetical protein